MKRLQLISLSFLLFFAFINTYAQEKTYEVYTGKINNKLNITFVFATIVDGCGSTTYNAMYKYDGRENWIYLDVTHGIKNYCFIETFLFTGLFMVDKINTSFIGNWYNPNRKNIFPVSLQLQKTLHNNYESYEDIYDKLYFEIFNDC